MNGFCLVFACVGYSNHCQQCFAARTAVDIFFFLILGRFIRLIFLCLVMHFYTLLFIFTALQFQVTFDFTIYSSFMYVRNCFCPILSSSIFFFFGHLFIAIGSPVSACVPSLNILCLYSSKLHYVSSIFMAYALS